MTGRDPAELLAAFLEDEDAAFASGGSGRFWPCNHYRIAPLVRQAPRLLEADRRVDFYFHLMRQTGTVPTVSGKETPLLLAAYRRLLPVIDRPDKAQIARRHPLLFIFGFDAAGALASGEAGDPEALKTRLKLLALIGKYTSIPAQWAKKERFPPFAGEAERLLQTLRHLGYRHDRRYGDDLYDYTNLTFWGMVLVILLNGATRAALLRDLLDGDHDLPRREQHFGILNRAVSALRPDFGAAETEFHALADRLAAIEAARRATTETVALARRLGLPFDDDEDWRASVTITPAGDAPDADLFLSMSPDPDNPWRIGITHPTRGRFSEWDGRVTQNDPGFPGLGAGNLGDLPAWLRTLRDKHGVAFDLEAANIHAGRKRQAAKRIAEWLRG